MHCSGSGLTTFFGDGKTTVGSDGCDCCEIDSEDCKTSSEDCKTSSEAAASLSDRSSFPC